MDISWNLCVPNCRFLDITPLFALFFSKYFSPCCGVHVKILFGKLQSLNAQRYIFWPVYNFNSLVVYTSFVIGAQYSGGKENRDLENCRLFSKGFSKYVLLVLLHVWEFYSPQLNCSCLDFFALHDLIDMSVMYTYIFMLEN